jgi:hypothetical protein
VNLTNAAWDSSFAAFHQGCVSFAHHFLIRRSSGGAVQGSSSGGQQQQHTMIDCRGLPATNRLVPLKPAKRRSRVPQVVEQLLHSAIQRVQMLRQRYLISR